MAGSAPVNADTSVRNGVFIFFLDTSWSPYILMREGTCFVAVYCIKQLEFYAKHNGKFSQGKRGKQRYREGEEMLLYSRLASHGLLDDVIILSCTVFQYCRCTMSQNPVTLMLQYNFVSPLLFSALVGSQTFYGSIWLSDVSISPWTAWWSSNSLLLP